MALKKSVDKTTSKFKFKISKKTVIYVLMALFAVGLIYLVVKVMLAATVNGQPVGRLAVIRELERQGGKKTLDVVILRTLIYQQAKKNKISVTQKDIDEEIKKIEKNISSQGTTLDQLLEQQGMTRNSLIEDIRLQLSVKKLAGEDVRVTDKEIDDYIAAQKEQLVQTGQEAPEMPRDQVKEQLKQQKLQEKMQTFITDLKTKAKINYFIKY